MAAADRPTEVSVRNVTHEDVPFLQRMLYEAANKPGDEWPPLEISINEPRNLRFWINWGRPSDIGVVAEASSSPIGAAWIRRFEPAERSPIDHDDALVLAIGIESPFRGQGVGHRLMETLIERARLQAVEAIDLTTGLFNVAAVRLYKAHGFVETRRRGDAIQMRLTLSPPRG